MTLTGQITSTFRVEVRGSGSPLIFLPDLACSGQVWEDTLHTYCLRHECHVLHVAGFADETPANAVPFLETIKEELAAYIKENSLTAPVIVGHSVGGFIGMWLAADHPYLVSSLVLIDTFPFYAGAGNKPDATPESGKLAGEQMLRNYASPPVPDYEATAESAKRLLVSRPDHVARVVLWRRVSDRLTMGRVFYELLSTDLRARMADVIAPTLVIGVWAGKRDFAGRTKEQAEHVFYEQYARTPNWRLIMMDDVRHFVMLDDPEALVRATESFLENLQICSA
jgi:N-formylmaleamate deformylase